MSDVFEVSYVFHRNYVGRLQTVTVDIKQIHSVDIVSLYLLNKIFELKKTDNTVNFGMRCQNRKIKKKYVDCLTYKSIVWPLSSYENQSNANSKINLPQCSYNHGRIVYINCVLF